MNVGVDLGDLDPLGIYDPLLAKTLQDRIAYISRASDALARKITTPATNKKEAERLESFLSCFPSQTYADWYLTWKKWAKKTEEEKVWFMPIVIRDTQEIVERNEAEFKGYYEKAAKCGMDLPKYAEDRNLVDAILDADFSAGELGFGAGLGAGTLLVGVGIGLAIWMTRK